VGVLTAAYAVVASGALLVTLSGCGGGDTTPIEQEKPVTEELKDSMNYMQQKYSKKGGSKN
jgi:hypothetical protein